MDAMRIRTFVFTLVAGAALLAPAGARAGRHLRSARGRGRRVAVLQRHARRPSRAARRDDDRHRQRVPARRRVAAGDARRRPHPLDAGRRGRLRLLRHRARQRLRAERRHRRGRVDASSRRGPAAATLRRAPASSARRRSWTGSSTSARPRRRRPCCRRSTRRPARSSGSSVVDEDDGGGLDSSPVPFNGMVFQAFKGDESSNHSKPGFVIVDGSREGGGEILAKTT